MPRGLGATSDNPVEILNRAEHLAYDADTMKPGRGRALRLREAAELGWLACSSAADVASVELGVRPPKGFNARQDVFVMLAQQAGMSDRDLVLLFVTAQEYLHADCFHEDAGCTKIRGLLHSVVRSLVENTYTAMSRLPRRRR